MGNRSSIISLVIKNAFEKKQEWTLHELYDIVRQNQSDLDDFKLRKRVRSYLAYHVNLGKIKRVKESTYFKI
jgi:hypothetical protein